MRERRSGLVALSSVGAVVGALLLALALPHCSAEDPTAHPTLALGSAAPDFSLPGIDGKTHTLAEYKAAKVLVIVFTCDHCPTAQLYESRLKKLVEDYKGKSVQFVMIEPNDPEAVRLDELAWTDVGDGLEDMKVRAAYRHFNFPYLYDGATQATANAYGPKATPHVFIFDAQRKLRYEGRVDNSQRESLVTTQDTRNAIDALLADKPVLVDHTGVFGCSTKWKSKPQLRRSRSCAPTRPESCCWSISGPHGAAPAWSSSPTWKRPTACSGCAISRWSRWRRICPMKNPV
jgi:thiol-disulfide isomerase/thioredoxin